MSCIDGFRILQKDDVHATQSEVILAISEHCINSFTISLAMWIITAQLEIVDIHVSVSLLQISALVICTWKHRKVRNRDVLYGHKLIFVEVGERW